MLQRFMAAIGYVTVLCAVPASAQDKPWELFLDPQSTSACDVVNADNAELVVLSATQQLVIVTGTDVVLEDTFVDENGFVFFEEEPVGTLDFATDGDGLRSLWWLSLTGTVVRVDGFTGEPSLTNNTPDDYENLPCDACEFWDDPAFCEGDDDPADPPTVRLCGSQIDVPITTAMLGWFGVRFARRRRVSP